MKRGNGDKLFFGRGVDPSWSDCGAMLQVGPFVVASTEPDSGDIKVKL